MSAVPFAPSNNWDEHPELVGSVDWELAGVNDRGILFTGKKDSQEWSIRLNNFPDEPAYTLLVDDEEVIHFDNWPAFWGPQPPR